MLKKGKLLPLIFSGVTAAAVSLATVSCSFEHNPLTVEGPYEYMVETGGKIQPETDYDPYKVELHEAQVKTGVTMSINPISYIGDEVWDYIAINEEGYLYTKDGFTADEPRTLTFTVHAEYKDEKENKNYECDSAIVSIAIVEPSGKQAVIDGGESFVPLKRGVEHKTETPFTMLVNDELQSGVEFSLEEIDPNDPQIPAGIDKEVTETTGPNPHTECRITVANTTNIGQFSFKVQGKISQDGDDDIVASVIVTVLISDNEYVLSGGSTFLDLYLGESGADTMGTWRLYKDDEEITDSVNINFMAGTEDWIKIDDGSHGHPKNTVYWDHVPADPGTVSLVAKAGDVILKSVGISFNVKTPISRIDISGEDEITNQLESNAYTCNPKLDPLLEVQSTTWHAETASGEEVDITDGKVKTDPSLEDFYINIWPIVSIVLRSGYEAIPFNADGGLGMKTVHVVPPYDADGATGTYCWGDLDSNPETPAAWWLLDEGATGFEFEKVGDSSTTSTVAKTAFDSPIYFGKDRMVVDTNKLNGAEAFDSDITFPSRPFVIGDDFLSGCTSYNTSEHDPKPEKQWLNYDNYCTGIGNSFMYGCGSVAIMYVPESVVSVGLDFMVNCYSLELLNIFCPILAFNQDSDMTLTVDQPTAPAFLDGVELLGEDGSIASEFQAMFPEITDEQGDILGYYRHTY